MKKPKADLKTINMARLVAGLNLKQLAEKSGQPYMRVRDLMRGKACPPGVVRGVCQSLGLPLEMIWK